MKASSLAVPRSTWLLPVLLACSSLTVMSGATIAPGLPGLVLHFADYPNADFLARLILTAPGLAIALSAPIAGLMADRIGRKTLLESGIVLYIAAGSAGLWLDDLMFLLVSRLFLGVAVGFIMVCSTALLTDHFQGPERNRAMGIQSSAMSGGAIVFLSAGSILADLSWRAPFGVYLLPFLLIPLVYVFVSRPAASQAHADSDTGQFPFAHAALLYGLGFFGMMLFYLIPTQLPFYALELGAGNLKVAGFAIVLSQVFSAVASAGYQRLRGYLNTAQILLLSYLLIGIGFVLLAAAESVTLMYFAMPFLGLGLGFNFPNLTIWLMSEIPADMRGRASGGMTTAVFTGQFLSPLISQPLVTTHGLSNTFLYAGVAAVSLAMIPWVVRCVK
ncbi:MAG: MFS transporter, partial [Granulosicoccus sp.]